MKKILILNGAGKANGNTAAMIRAFTGAAEESGNEIRELRLQQMNIHGCLDCHGCYRKPQGPANPCVQQDDMEKIYQDFAWADVVVFASPVYFWDISGVLKTAVDRLFGAVRNWGGAACRKECGGAACRKECALLMTSGGSDISHMLDWYMNFERWMGWRNIGYAMNDTRAAAKIGAGIK